MGSSSLTRDQTQAPCIVSKSLSHWSTRGVPWGLFSNKMSKMQVVVWNRKYLCSGVSAVAERPPRSSTCVTHLSSVFIRFTHLQHCFSFFKLSTGNKHLLCGLCPGLPSAGHTRPHIDPISPLCLLLIACLW